MKVSRQHVLIVTLALLCFVLFLRAKYHIYVVNGNSMEPTLHCWEVIQAHPLGNRVPKEGEAILFRRGCYSTWVKRIAILQKTDHSYFAYVLGDALDNSEDSREFGWIHKTSIIGVVDTDISQATMKKFRGYCDDVYRVGGVEPPPDGIWTATKTFQASLRQNVLGVSRVNEVYTELITVNGWQSEFIVKQQIADMNSFHLGDIVEMYCSTTVSNMFPALGRVNSVSIAPVYDKDAHDMVFIATVGVLSDKLTKLQRKLTESGRVEMFTLSKTNKKYDWKPRKF